MKHVISTILLLLCVIGLRAQENKLTINDLSIKNGETLRMNVNLDNSADVVAVQFTMKAPEGITFSPESAILTDRAAGHAVTMREVSSKTYTVVIMSMGNNVITGHSGALMSVNVSASKDLESGTVLPVEVSSVIITGRDAKNVCTSTSSTFNLTVQTGSTPDLECSSVTTNVNEIIPGQKMKVNWSVKNIGDASTRAGWKEEIALVSADGSKTIQIASSEYNGRLAPNTVENRYVDMVLPLLLGIDGDVYVQVKVIPKESAGEPVSAQENNTQKTKNLIVVRKLLSLELGKDRIAETDGGQVSLRVSRSGNKDKAETFAIANDAGGRVNMPASIKIPANSNTGTVYFTVIDNDTTDLKSDFTITVSGNDYPEATASFVIEDNEMPSLTVSASKTDVEEGETFQLTVATSRASSEPIVVSLICENAKRFKYPTEVVIPAGSNSVTLDVYAIDNADIESHESVSFRAIANGYEEGECLVMLNDNDMPTLSLTISPEAVSESAGSSALFGIIKRTDNLDKRVTIKLSDDSNGMLYYENNTIVLDKNKAEVQFSIGVKDNDAVDGNREVTVTAAVYSSSCNCSVPTGNHGDMTAKLTILDDDGPSLKIMSAKPSMLEGSEDNMFTISHNVKSDADVTVYVSSDMDDMLEYSHEQVIPAGMSEVSFPVKVKNNDVEDDDIVATFKAEGKDFCMGTCWLMITDHTRPDATVSLYADKTEVVAEGNVLLRAVVKNIGSAYLPSTTPVVISFSGRKETVKLTVGNYVAMGDSAVVEYNYDIPAITGSHTFKATVNSPAKIAEQIYTNNASEEVNIIVRSPYTLTAQAEKKTYNQNDSIRVTGVVSGERGKNAEVEVYFINDGGRISVNTTTDAEGKYSVVWKPLTRQTGHFVVGACYPGAEESAEMDAFDVIGISVADDYQTRQLHDTEIYNGKIAISNLCSIAQNGLKITKKAESETASFVFNVPETIGAGETIDINYTIRGKAVSEGDDWEEMPIEITTDEGSSFAYTIYYYVSPQKATLKADCTSINTTMTYGVAREYPVTVKNIGRAETGKITLALPNWIQTSTPSEISSLAQGDSTVIMLRFNPMDNMKLDVAVTGQIGINCANGNGVPVRFSITPVSETTGKLNLDVVDEFTFYTDEAPHVAQAKVSVKKISTGEVVAEGETKEDGTFLAEIPAGRYSVTVDADKHKSYERTIIVDPGTEKNEEVFISYQAVTYTWDVQRTEIEDVYLMETVAKFNTRVPKPVVTVKLPRNIDLTPKSIIPVQVKNNGLINVINVKCSIETSSNLHVEMIGDKYLDVLGAQQSHIFYARVISNNAYAAGAKSNRAPMSADACYQLIARLRYEHRCEKYTNEELAQDIIKQGNSECLQYIGTSTNNTTTDSLGLGKPNQRGNRNYNGFYFDTVDGGPTKVCTPQYNPDDEPIDREEVSDDDVPEIDCGEEPVLVYKLVPVTGTRYSMEGVAADGVSQVKLVLDPKHSRIPASNCNDCYGFTWELSKEGFGKIERISDWEAIYTAPSEYPADDVSSSTCVYAKLKYRQRFADGYIGWLEDGPSVRIEIVRPPVVFIHGLGDNRTRWYDAEKYLVNMGYYKKHYNYRADYRHTNASTFMDNVEVVSDGIRIAKKKAKRLGYVATKCDLVGHSMGGILARLHVERLGQEDDVNRIITVNTPHAGSEWGDMVTAHPKLSHQAVKWFYGKDDIDAVEDLGVESEETSLLVNVAGHSKIPVYALGTQSDLREPLLYVGNDALKAINELLLAADVAAVVFDPEPLSKVALALLAVSIACNEGQHLLMDDYIQIGDGDLVVSSESQRGGCNASEIIEHGPWHVSSPKDYKVYSRIKELLLTPPSDNTFSKTWFTPKKRNFKHDNWEVWRNRFLNIIPVVGSELSYLQNKFYEIDSKLRMIKSVVNALKPSNAKGQLVSSNDSQPKEISLALACVYLNGRLVYMLNDEINEYTIPDTFGGEVTVKMMYRDNEGNLYTDERSETVEALAKPEKIETENIYLVKGAENFVKVDCTWDNGEVTSVSPTEVVFDDKAIASYSDGYIKGLKTGMTHVTIKYGELTCNANVYVFGSESYIDDDSYKDDPNSNSICSTITLSFKQKAVMTREAFRGTLTVSNGNEAEAMTGFKLNLEVRDKNGRLATSREFQINAEELDGFEGENNLSSAWKLGAGETGKATVLFIPTKNAAPKEPKDYSFGGWFSYTDPYTGLTVKRDLNPVTLTVNPSPELNMDYFLQRDVIGDDPLTEAVESSEDAEFALLINNVGYGDAKNVTMTTNRPEIVENEKGLLINFDLIGSQLNGGEKTLALGGDVTTDFGTISAKNSAYAQWWMRSSLLGHFTKYEVKATHVTSYDNPDLSLLGEVCIHELIRSLTVGDGVGFLVNDIKDANDTPDRLYLSNGNEINVEMVSSIQMKNVKENEYEITVEGQSSKWCYGKMLNMRSGKAKILKVVRKSDGKEMPLRNFWTTEVTMRDGHDPVHENIIHVCDSMLSGQETYILTFESMPEKELEIKAIEGIPAQGSIAKAPLKTLNVIFNKVVKPETFTADDLLLRVEGVLCDANRVEISTEDSVNFTLDIETLGINYGNGFYSLDISTENITDAEGFEGSSSKNVNWTYLSGGNEEHHVAEVALGKGWNWVSFGLNNKSLQNVNTVLEDGLWTADDEVKNDNDFITYSGKRNKWFGSLADKGFSNDVMYKLYANEKQLLKLNGSLMAESEPIAVKSGWNYIPYQPQKDAEISLALADYKAGEGDVLKSINEMAVYDAENGWVGTLKSMQHGVGYMLNRQGDDTQLKYAKDLFFIAQQQNSTVAQAKNSLYADNMCIIAEVKGVDDICSEDTIVALVNGEERGRFAAKEVGNLAFMTIGGEQNDEISFAMLRDGKMVASSATSICYGTNDVRGSLSYPMEIKFEKMNAHSHGAVNIWPRVVTDFVNVSVYGNGGLYSVCIYDMAGQMLKKVTRSSLDRNVTLRIDCSDLSKDVYVIKVYDADVDIATEKLIKK